MIPSDISRRHFVQTLAGSLLGLHLAPRLAFAQTKSSADHIIYLFMSGGMSHLDTFDLRPDDAAIQGPVSGIPTKVPGIHVTDKLPRLAQQMHRISQVRSMTHTQGNHEPGKYHVRTGYDMGSRVVAHPALGSWIHKHAPKLNPDLPAYVRIGDMGGHPSSGFFSAAHGPLPISSAELGLQNSALLTGQSSDQFIQDLQLSAKLDQAHRAHRAGSSQLAALTDLYAEAVKLMSSEELDGFDIAKESAKTRADYGKTPFGQGCLLARRLVERGARFVEVDLGGWDTHTDNHEGVARQCNTLDAALSALLLDLESRGLLQRTLVVVTTEFGRDPEIDEFGGRNHNPFGFTSLLAGGGISGGAVHGKTEPKGKGVASDPVTVADFNTTLAHALGLNPQSYESPTPSGQRFSISGKDTAPVKGQPLTHLFT
jgi:uncharacterized protein (DUF1501 family)